MATDFLSNLFLPNVEIPQAKISVKLPSVGGSLQVVTICDILRWVKQGLIKAYPNNRGSGTFSFKTSEAVYNNLKADAIGECSVGYVNGQLYLCDFHSRLAGIIRRLNDGKLTEEELNIPVSLRVSENAITAYQLLNASDPHRAKDKIVNPDHIFGSYITKINEAVGSDCLKMMGKRMSTVLSCILYNFYTSPDPATRRWDWSYVYRLRQVAAKKAADKAGNLVMSDDDVKSLIEGVRFWHLLMRDLNVACPSNINKIRNSTGFFGYILCKHLDKCKFPKMDVMVDRIIKNLAEFSNNCSHLCRGNANEVGDFVEKIEKVLKIKSS